MQSILKKYFWTGLVLGICLTLLGLSFFLVTAFGDSTNITKIFCVLFGIYIIVFGIFGFAIGIVEQSQRKEFILNSIPFAVSIAAGIFLCLPVATDVLEIIIINIVPLILMACGGVSIIHSIFEITFKESPKIWAYRLAIGLVVLILGILAWVGKEQITNIIYIILGIIVSLIGILLIIFGIIAIRKHNKSMLSEEGSTAIVVKVRKKD